MGSDQKRLKAPVEDANLKTEIIQFHVTLCCLDLYSKIMSKISFFLLTVKQLTKTSLELENRGERAPP